MLVMFYLNAKIQKYESVDLVLQNSELRPKQPSRAKSLATDGMPLRLSLIYFYSSEPSV